MPTGSSGTLTDGDTTGRLQTMASRSSRGEVGHSLIADMARQCRLNRAEFLALVDCSLTEADYRRKLTREGALGAAISWARPRG